tara:strand:+ start:354 stop:1109 length:756 start_codon:yes stop_codon:yes gene_type:complete
LKAILLAAGSGMRLGDLTKETPKALVDINGKTLLERQIIALQKNNINDIIVVTGPNNDKFDIKDITYIHDSNYLEHDVLGTMMSASEYMNSDVIISYTDIVFDEKIIHSIKNVNNDINIAVEMDWTKTYVDRTEHPIDEAANVLIEDGLVKKIGHQTKRFGFFKKDNLGEFLGIMKLSQKGADVFKSEYQKLIKKHENEFHEAVSIKKGYITDMIQELLDKNYKIYSVIVSGNWCEIDTLQDLEIARKMFL